MNYNKFRDNNAWKDNFTGGNSFLYLGLCNLWRVGAIQGVVRNYELFHTVWQACRAWKKLCLLLGGVLGLLIVPEPELALVYAAFGWYPILRPKLNRIPSRPLRLVVKILLCTAVILLLYGVLLRLLGMTADLIGTASLFNLLLLVLGILTFLLTDLALERLTFLWRKRFRKRFFR